MTLVILAAGMGSRFGGLKQIEPVDDNGNFIIDYSVYDAVKAGFNKIVFVINRENFKIFKNTIGNRISDLVEVKYAFQENDNLKLYLDIPENRTKPFGTAHALYCAKEYIEGPFGIISADDFYGYGAFKQLYDSLNRGECSAIGYKLKNTMSDNGTVKRGICFSKNGYLTQNNDYVIEKIDNKIVGTSLVDNTKIELNADQEVSMLMYGLNYSVIDYIEKGFKHFFEINKNNLEKCEYLLPIVLTDMIEDNKIRVKLIPTKEKWMGVTYKEDLKILKDYLQSLIKDNNYPKSLYKKKGI